MNKRTSVVIFLSIIISARVCAFGFRPITMDFSPAGRDSGKTFLVENTTDSQIAVRIRMYHRDMDRFGNDSLVDAKDLFAVFPAQMALAPGASQAVRVQWRGPSSIDRERAFRIVAEQVPVRTENAGRTGGSIEIMFRYRGSVYVVPDGARHDVQVVAAEVVREDSERYLQLEIENVGSAHVILQDLTILLTVEGEQASPTITLGSDRLPGVTGENLLAGVRRVFRIEMTNDIPEGEISVELDFRPVR